MSELVQIEKITIPEVFKPYGLDLIIEKIKKEVSEFKADISTAKGRADVRSMASKVAKSKTYIDFTGKDYVSKLKEIPKVVDAERKRMREALDILRDEVRSPLTEWEKEQEVIKRKAQIAQEEIEAHEQALIDNLNYDKQIELEAREKEIAEKERIQNEKEEAEKLEKDRIEKETSLKIEKEHQRKINQKAVTDFKKNGVSSDNAKTIIGLIVKGKISNVTINY